MTQHRGGGLDVLRDRRGGEDHVSGRRSLAVFPLATTRHDLPAKDTGEVAGEVLIVHAEFSRAARTRLRPGPGSRPVPRCPARLTTLPSVLAGVLMACLPVLVAGIEADLNADFHQAHFQRFYPLLKRGVPWRWPGPAGGDDEVAHPVVLPHDALGCEVTEHALHGGGAHSVLAGYVGQPGSYPVAGAQLPVGDVPRRAAAASWCRFAAMPPA